ncbi:GDP-mannose 4,6-dehydratase [Paenibacillus sediminis]|uniref:GDP-4-dehydro-6-deoxy-D-mannose reductase n=1 Tax=Paenibacillus sediminis TaxID=664909 RepID=A0ABS4H256_9BACL|nr:GDP-mannose 4,6-dehydratase [Paenibacillus sediminis]MBP1936605.1 GDP-4-dehydro-6-deoxy-D-mannose reductase [Paenibacillus sediminis]
MKALITGVSGFVGNFLTEKLLRIGYEVAGISRSKPDNKDLNFISCDITDSARLEKILKTIRPDEIYHLAGSAFIPYSYKEPMYAYSTIVSGTLSLYESLRKLDMDSKVLFVGSAEVYGEGQTSPFTEKDLLRPNNPYAGAKACADLISEQYAKTFQMKIIRARPFNHTGPKQSDNFVCSSFAKQIAEMEYDGHKTIYVGNINVKRDFLDVRDVVNAYYLLMKKGTSGEAYNVSSNKAVSISELLDWLFLFSNIESPNIEVDLNKVRANDALIRLGDNTKLCQDTGWLQEHDLKETMRVLLEYWRSSRASGRN